jgi:signal transduction histidine kinase
MISPKVAKGHAENPFRMLHLEDSASDHLLTRMALRAATFAFSIEQIESLEEFTQLIATNTYDIVLADYHLHGFTVLDAWARVPACFEGPFILLSGAIGESAAVAAIQMGMSDYLHKDELSKLPRVVDRSLRLKLVSAQKSAADKDLLDSKLRLAKFAGYLQDTIDEERASIAREIHDDIGGTLTAVRLDLGWAARHVTDQNVLMRIHSAASMLQHAMGASQRIMHNLRPSVLDQGLVAAGKWLAEDFERRTQIVTRFYADDCRGQHTKEIQLTAYRTIQEALTNTMKYAEATLVSIDLSDADNVLTVEISDDGKGIAPEDREKSNSYGLRGLEERANSAGGWLDVSSAIKGGTSVILSIPTLNHTEAARDAGMS